MMGAERDVEWCVQRIACDSNLPMESSQVRSMESSQVRSIEPTRPPN